MKFYVKITTWLIAAASILITLSGCGGAGE